MKRIILHIEDDKGILTVFEEWLEALAPGEFEVIGVRDSVTALEKLNELGTTIELVVLDGQILDSPEDTRASGTSRRVFEALMQEFPIIPAITTTMWPELRAEYVSRGVPYVPKGIDSANKAHEMLTR